MIFLHKNQWYRVVSMTPISEHEARARSQYESTTGEEMAPISIIVDAQGKVIGSDDEKAE